MAAMQIKARHQEIAIKIALAAGLCALFFHLIIRPVFSESVMLRQEIRESQGRLQLFKDVERVKDELKTAEEPLVAMPARSTLVGRISDIANKKKIDVQTLSPQTNPGDAYVNLKIDMSGEAPFFSLLNFLKEMETLVPPMSVSSMSLLQQSYVKTSSAPGGKLQIHLSLETYLLKHARKGDKS